MPDEGLLGVAIRHSTAEPIRRSYNLANGTVLELQIGGVNGFFWQERYAGILDRLYEEITKRLDQGRVRGVAKFWDTEWGRFTEFRCNWIKLCLQCNPAPRALHHRLSTRLPLLRQLSASRA